MKKIIVKVKNMLNASSNIGQSRDAVQDQINKQAASPIPGWTL